MKVLLWAILLSGAAAAVVLASLGAATVASGRSGGWLALSLGVQLLAMIALVAVDLRRYRGTPPPAVTVDGGVLLPVRPGFVGRKAAVVLILGTLCLTAGTTAGGTGPVLLGVAGFVLFAGYAGWLLTRADHRIRVDPAGVTLPAARAAVPWREVQEVTVDDRGWQPQLVVRPKAGPPHACSLLAQGWPAAALVELLTRAARQPAYRKELVSAEAVERAGTR